MKVVSTSILLAAMLLSSSIASAEFVLNNTSGPIGDERSGANGDVTGSFPAFTLSGSDGRQQDGYITTYTDTFSSDATINFDFTYLSGDSGGAQYDPAGYLVNDVFTQLSPAVDKAYAPFSGSVTVSVLAGDLFGFYVRTNDNIGGRALLTVNANVIPSAVPVPAALPLMASVLGIFGIARRRK